MGKLTISPRGFFYGKVGEERGKKAALSLFIQSRKRENGPVEKKTGEGGPFWVGLFARGNALRKSRFQSWKGFFPSETQLIPTLFCAELSR